MDEESMDFFATAALERAPALHDSNQEQDDRQDKQEVDEPADGVGRDQPQNPKEQQNDCDCFEHIFGFSCAVMRKMGINAFYG